ncbi:MAG: four-helix bundle copper-binding protein [Bacteroidota bacterium]
MNYHDYKKCIDACLECAALCNHCASSCLQEKDVKMMARCVQLDMECAALCYTAAQFMSLGSDRVNELCGICHQVCIACADECDQHDNEHCRECAKACRACAEECAEMAE